MAYKTNTENLQQTNVDSKNIYMENETSLSLTENTDLHINYKINNTDKENGIENSSQDVNQINSRTSQYSEREDLELFFCNNDTKIIKVCCHELHGKDIWDDDVSYNICDCHKKLEIVEDYFKKPKPLQLAEDYNKQAKLIEIPEEEDFVILEKLTNEFADITDEEETSCTIS